MSRNFLRSFNVGERLLEAPVPELIESLGKAIASAQYEMDATAVEIGEKLGNTTVSLRDENGKEVERSLLELGFTPSFYHFQEATIEVKMTINLEVEAGARITRGGGEEDAEEDDDEEESKSVIPIGSSLSLDVHGKFGFDQEGSSKITAKLVSIPSPSAFADALRRHAGAAKKSSGKNGAPGSDDSEKDETKKEDDEVPEE